MIQISPTTIKVILHVLQKIIEDEETRKLLFYIIFIPIVFIILLTSMVYYIFTLPFASISDYFEDSFFLVEEFMDEYNYEFGYLGENGYMFNTDYEIGDFSEYDAFDEEMFARLMSEAVKYIGMPYVFGGSNPTTSFDCSGFICWVYTESGVFNLPRTTAQGIFNQSIPLPKEEAKAGDLVFFQGTYNSVGIVSHIGIYLGDGKMLHCGSPIGYADLTTAYWEKHFYAFGRLPILNTEES